MEEECRAPREVGHRHLIGPHTLLGIAVAFSVALAVILAWHALTASRTLTHLADHHVVGERLAEEVDLLDEVLTDSAYLAAATGDLSWVTRYEDHAARLRVAVARARQLGDAGVLDSAAIDHIESNHARRSAIEAEAISAVRAGQPERALDQLRSQEYRAVKLRYAIDVDALVADVRQGTDGRVAAARNRALVAIAAAMFGLLMTVTVSGMLFVRLRRWTAALDQANTRQLEDIERESRRSAEEVHNAELAEHERLLTQLVRSAPISLFATDRHGMITMAKGKVIDAAYVQHRNLLTESVFDIYGHRPQIIDAIEQALSGSLVSSRLDLGEGVVYEIAYVPTFSAADPDEITGVVGIHTDISASARLESELRHQAEHDALTGLLNRSSFAARLESALATASDTTCLLIVDIDGFKEINDSRGHEIGDRALMELGERMVSCVRSTDAVARLGGDEFGVIVEAAGLKHIDALANRLLLAVAAPILDETGLIELSASMGIVGIGLGDRTPEQAMRDGDIAMYEAKRGGGDRFVEFNPEMGEQFTARIRMKEELDTALALGQLCLQYQPLWDADSGHPVGVEALVRWEHPTRGLLAPGTFLPLAEETGQISDIDCWVMREACRQTASWRGSDNPVLQQLWVSVNVSAIDFGRLDVPGLVSDVLADTGLDPGGLVIEITETAVMENLERTVGALDAISNLGVAIALDDFGAGYSSFSQLQRLNVDVLKVDRMFVADGSDAGQVSLAGTIVGLGKLLGLRVVAEGVETDAQLRTMQSVGCDVIQGFLLARPQSASACEDLFDQAELGGSITRSVTS